MEMIMLCHESQPEMAADANSAHSNDPQAGDMRAQATRASSDRLSPPASGRVLAVCISHGGIPKKPVPAAQLVFTGLVGDGHAHEKHIRPHRALLIQDDEKLDELRREGFDLGPGTLGENLTVRHLHVQELSPGTRLRLEGGPLLELSEPRQPCFVLDQIDSRLQTAVVGRCGYLAKVVEEGPVHEGQRIDVISD
jgi:MOSC domain-containing protein YiiM